MKKYITDIIDDADENADIIIEYLKLILESLKEIEKALRQR